MFDLVEPAGPACPIWPVTAEALEGWLAGRDERTRAWAKANDFDAKAGQCLRIADEDGGLAGIVFGVPEAPDLWSYAGLPGLLPPGRFAFDAGMAASEAAAAALGWALGTYRYDRYRAADKPERAELIWPDGADRDRVSAAAAATFLVRDLINTPAADLGPSALAGAAERLAAEAGATFRQIVGDDLVAENYPMIHAVGRAAADPPRLIDLTWGEADDPKVTLVGKGVCFDSGGLDLKTASGMALMKKDMGGGAIVLGLAQMIMRLGLRVRLRVLVPAVENAVGGNAFRPGDVLKSRAGKTVEIGNTDAEGRLVLADALAEAARETPDLLIDVATLTGAARVAVGTEIAALFTDDGELARDLARLGEAEADPIWRQPLWKPYRKLIDSKIADINNAGRDQYAGAITAALFLAEFVDGARSWAHFDVMAWNLDDRPGRPVGGEAFAMRALFALLAERYHGAR